MQRDGICQSLNGFPNVVSVNSFDSDVLHGHMMPSSA